MAEEHWQPARLIPTSGISNLEEAEQRATSALLAVMGAVREFGLAIVKPLGAPAGQLDCFIEVPFKTGDERTCRPDGLVQTSRGGRTWTLLIEVKTGTSNLERGQVETYLDVARDNGFDAVLTISNQLSPAPGVHPVEVDKRKLRKVTLHHLSWAEVLTLAVQHRVHRGISDPDQAWILGELIRYLEHPRSGALDFVDMGAAWVAVRDSVAAGTLRSNDKGLAEVVSRWEQLLRFAALRLGRELGADVQVVLSRKELADPSLRFAGQAQSLVSSGRLTGALRVPNAAAGLDVSADLATGRISVSADVEAPREGRATTRVGWLVRQLKDAPEGLRIEAWATGSRSSASDLLRAVRENPSTLIEDPKRDLRSFRVTAVSNLGPKRGTGRGGFIDSVLIAIDGFYAGVLQQLRPWSARAPQLPKDTRTAAETAGVDIAIPPSDADAVDASPTTPEPDEVPSVIEDAVDTGLAEVSGVGNDEDEPAPSWAVAEPAGDVVSWDHAQERLDHERTMSEDGEGHTEL